MRGDWVPGRAYHGPTPGKTHQEIVLGWITAVILPPVGLIIGIRLIGTYERNVGIAMTIVSALMCVLVASWIL